MHRSFTFIYLNIHIFIYVYISIYIYIYIYIYLYLFMNQCTYTGSGRGDLDGDRVLDPVDRNFDQENYGESNAMAINEQVYTTIHIDIDICTCPHTCKVT